MHDGGPMRTSPGDRSWCGAHYSRRPGGRRPTRRGRGRAHPARPGGPRADRFRRLPWPLRLGGRAAPPAATARRQRRRGAPRRRRSPSSCGAVVQRPAGDQAGREVSGGPAARPRPARGLDRATAAGTASPGGTAARTMCVETAASGPAGRARLGPGDGSGVTRRPHAASRPERVSSAAPGCAAPSRSSRTPSGATVRAARIRACVSQAKRLPVEEQAGGQCRRQGAAQRRDRRRSPPIRHRHELQQRRIGEAICRRRAGVRQRDEGAARSCTADPRNWPARDRFRLGPDPRVQAAGGRAFAGRRSGREGGRARSAPRAPRRIGQAAAVARAQRAGGDGWAGGRGALFDGIANRSSSNTTYGGRRSGGPSGAGRLGRGAGRLKGRHASRPAASNVRTAEQDRVDEQRVDCQRGSARASRLQWRPRLIGGDDARRQTAERQRQHRRVRLRDVRRERPDRSRRLAAAVGDDVAAPQSPCRRAGGSGGRPGRAAAPRADRASDCHDAGACPPSTARRPSAAGARWRRRRPRCRARHFACGSDPPISCLAVAEGRRARVRAAPRARRTRSRRGRGPAPSAPLARGRGNATASHGCDCAITWARAVPRSASQRTRRPRSR